MAAFLAVSIFTTFFLLHVQSIIGQCPTKPRYCPGDLVEIRFPFWIQDTDDPLCGYPGFNLACNNRNQIIIHLPQSGDFMVTLIDYEHQSLRIDDPDGCLLSRLSNITLSDTPFDYEKDLYQFTLANCTSIKDDEPELSYIPCLSNQNHAVYYVEGDMDKYSTYLNNLGCSVWSVSIPRRRNQYYWGNSLWLRWEHPNCKSCEKSDGTCIRKMNYTDVGCVGGFTGFSSNARTWVFIAVALPWFACLFATAYYWGTRAQRHHQNQQSIELLPTNAAGIAGLDSATIESYPKIQINGILELPRPNDNTCIICLAEYQRRETIRIVPDCNHYFHAYCIDQWLKRNATCPVCRNHKGFSDSIDAR